MPLVDTKHPNTLPHVTPKAHFSGLSLSVASRILAKISVRLEMYEAFFLACYYNVINIREYVSADLVL
jgi:hypothetical protein